MRANSIQYSRMIRAVTCLYLILCSIVLATGNVNISQTQSDPDPNQISATYSALVDSCSVYLEEEDYESAQRLALELYKEVENYEMVDYKLDALYYLVRSNYYLRNYEKCIQFGEEGINLAIEIDNKERLSYLYNIMGIVGRRTDNCVEAIDYYLLAIEVNRELDDSVKVSRNYNNLSLCYQVIGDYHKSFQALNTAKDIRASLKDTMGLANVFLNIGNGYHEISDYQAAYENYMKASELYESIGDEEMVVSSLFNIGLVFQELKDYDKALEFYEQALDHASSSSDDEFMGLIFQNIGNLYGSIENIQKSISYHKKAEEIFDTLNSYEQLSVIQMNMGLQYLHSSNLDSAGIYLYKAYDYIKDNSSIDNYINLMIELGHYHTLKKDYSLAEDFLTRSVALAESTEYLNLSSYANKYLFELYKKTGRMEKAIDHLIKYHMFKDSIDRSEQERNIENYKLRTDIVEQESKIEKLNMENELKTLEVEKANDQRKLFLSVMALMVFLIGGVSYQFQFARRKNKIISKEKERSDELLLNILPDETAEELKNFGKVKAKEYELTTVMFTDFVDFTKYSERMRSEDIVRSVDHYFSAFDRIVEKHGIEKIKTIGDAYMCVGGIPVADTDNAIRVVKAAKEIQAFVEKNLKEPEEGIVPFMIRIGINSGPVVAGVVGLHKFQYDVWGDTVNIASRMESSCESGCINISQRTYDLVKNRFPCSYRGEKELKNKGKMKMYYID